MPEIVFDDSESEYSESESEVSEVSSSESENESENETSSDSEEEETSPPRKEELNIKCLDLHQQILHRPDTYIGSVVKSRSSDYIWVYSESEKKIVKNTAHIEKLDSNGKPKLNSDGTPKTSLEVAGPNVSEGLIRTIVEIISNSIDNVWRSKEFGLKAKEIRFTLEDDKKITVWNDGKALIHGIHEKEKKHNIELIFSRLLTSTNYDDSKKRKTSGRNGYGAKLTNIFSELFTVESYNNESKSLYKQTWKNNMYNREEPIIKEKTIKGYTGSTGYTKVSWIPDYKRFSCKCINEDTKKVLYKYLYDTAMIVSKYDVKVFINDEQIKVNSLKDYAFMYFKDEPKEYITFSSKDSKVVLIPNDGHFAVSFINGILTFDGGVHVDSWCSTIFKTIANKMNKVKEPTEKSKKDTKEKEKEKKKKVFNLDNVRSHFSIFIDTEVNNPIFKSQNKTKYGGNEDGKPIDVVVKASDINKIMKWDVIDRIRMSVEMKDLAELNSKKRGFTRIENFEDAGAKGKDRMDCVFCVTEGLSAKTYVVNGMKYGLISRSGKIVKGRQYIAVLALKGKFINPNGKSLKAVVANKEVKNIIQILNLQTGLDYTKEENFETLRFGRFMVFADSDVDGNHIVGLLYNFFNTLYPSLLNVPGFFCFTKNPIITINNKSNQLAFYHQEKAKQYLEKNNISHKHINYYKGLGTFRDKMIKNYFGKRTAHLIKDEQTDELIDKSFGKAKGKSDLRKELINNFDASKMTLIEGKDYDLEEVEFSSYLNNELSEFAVMNCRRTIPYIQDGLKEGQRKIMYAVFKKNLKYSSKSMKVAQLGAYVAETTLYAHGEDNLVDTIRGMAQRYVGSNNLPYFFNDGQFGTRLEKGKDGASGRYIFTKAESYLRDLFPVEDDDYLENLIEESQQIEKKYYLPVICTLLCNGADGIGTGFSTNIPLYNPLDIITWQKKWVQTGNKNECGSLVPWYRNFKGKIEKQDDKYMSYGIIESIGKNKKKISEIPIGMSISEMRVELEILKENKAIKDFDDNSDDKTIEYIVTEHNDGMNLTIDNMNLKKPISISNLVVFSDCKNIKKYESVEDIIHEFCVYRLELYKVRHLGVISKLEKDLLYVKNKLRFIEEINLSDTDSKKLFIKDVSDEDLYKEMDVRGYLRKTENKKKTDEDEEQNEDEEEEKDLEGNYNYLLTMQIRGATKKRLDTLKSEEDDLVNKIKILKSKTPDMVWMDEMDRFEKSYKKWLDNADDDRDDHEGNKDKKKIKK